MKNKAVKVIMWIVIVIVAVAAIIAAVFGISSARGKAELENSASVAAPELPTFEEVLASASQTEEWGSVVNPMDMIEEIESMSAAQTQAASEGETSPAESSEAATETVTKATESPSTESASTEKASTAAATQPASTEGASTVAATQPVTTAPAVQPTTAANAEGIVTYNGTKYKYNDSILTFLVLGIDNNNTVSPAKDGISGGQSDAIFLVVLNQSTKKMNVISIPRDTIAPVAVYNKAGQYVMTMNTYLTLQHAYGDGMSVSNQRTVNAVSKLFYNLPIHGCVSINMGGIPALNDAIGGVDITSLYTFENAGYSFVEGQNYHLEGMSAFWYLKYRDTSRHFTAPERLQRQRQYIRAFYNQAMSRVKSQPTLAVDIYNTISSYMVTDVSANEVSYLASKFITGGYSFGTMRTLEGRQVTGSVYEEFHVDQTALYELILSTFYNVVE